MFEELLDIPEGAGQFEALEALSSLREEVAAAKACCAQKKEELLHLREQTAELVAAQLAEAGADEDYVQAAKAMWLQAPHSVSQAIGIEVLKGACPYKTSTSDDLVEAERGCNQYKHKPGCPEANGANDYEAEIEKTRKKLESANDDKHKKQKVLNDLVKEKEMYNRWAFEKQREGWALEKINEDFDRQMAKVMPKIEQAEKEFNDAVKEWQDIGAELSRLKIERDKKKGDNKHKEQTPKKHPEKTRITREVEEFKKMAEAATSTHEEKRKKISNSNDSQIGKGIRLDEVQRNASYVKWGLQELERAKARYEEALNIMSDPNYDPEFIPETSVWYDGDKELEKRRKHYEIKKRDLSKAIAEYQKL